MDLGARALLLLILREGPGFGLELVARVKARSRARVALNRGGASIALRRLEEEGMVRGWTRATRGSGRPRRYYELTPRGMIEAEKVRDILDGLREPDPLPDPRSDAGEMAQRVRRSSELTEFALRLRETVRTAGGR